MQTDNLLNKNHNFYQNSQGEHLSSGTLLKEVGKSVKDLIQSEVLLVTTELKESFQKIARDFLQAVGYGALLALSTLPFLAFLVIGLGEILNNNYWLSSLLVSVFLAAISAPLAMKAWNKIKAQDLDLPHSRESFARGARTVEQKLSEIKDAATGGNYENTRSHIY